MDTEGLQSIAFISFSYYHYIKMIYRITWILMPLSFSFLLFDRHSSRQYRYASHEEDIFWGLSSTAPHWSNFWFYTFKVKYIPLSASMIGGTAVRYRCRQRNAAIKWYIDVGDAILPIFLYHYWKCWLARSPRVYTCSPATDKLKPLYSPLAKPTAIIYW